MVFICVYVIKQTGGIMIFKYLVVGVSLLALSGCAGADYSNYALSVDQINQSGQQMVSSYFDKRAADNAMVMKALTSGGPENAQNNQMAVVLYTILSQQQDEKVLASFKPIAPVKPTTNADISMAFLGNTLPTLAKIGVGAWLGSEVIDGLSKGVTLGAGASYMKGTTLDGSYVNSPPVWEGPIVGGDFTPIPEVPEGATSITSSSSTEITPIVE